MRGEDFASIDNYQNDQQNNMGVDSGSYDPAGDTSAALMGGARIAEDIQNRNIGGDGDTYNARQALQTARGITATNPYGYEGFFSKNFGIDPEDIDYTYGGQTSLGDIADTANKNYIRYVNPMNDPNRAGFNPNKTASQTQKDLNKGFGSLLGSSLGEQTQLGSMREQKPDALSGMDTGALNVFSVFGGGLPSLMANQMANPSNFVPAETPQYQASRDPMSKSYDAETYDKSYMGNILDTLYGEGTTKQVSDAGTQIGDKISSEFDALVDGISFLNKPTIDKDLTTYPQAQNYGSRIKSGIGAIDPNVTQNAIDNIVSDNMASDRSPGFNRAF